MPVDVPKPWAGKKNHEETIKCISDDEYAGTKKLFTDRIARLEEYLRLQTKFEGDFKNSHEELTAIKKSLAEKKHLSSAIRIESVNHLRRMSTNSLTTVLHYKNSSVESSQNKNNMYLKTEWIRKKNLTVYFSRLNGRQLYIVINEEWKTTDLTSHNRTVKPNRRDKEVCLI